jgi:hypothetical protein
MRRTALGALMLSAVGMMPAVTQAQAKLPFRPRAATQPATAETTPATNPTEVAPATPRGRLPFGPKRGPETAPAATQPGAVSPGVAAVPPASKPAEEPRVLPDIEELRPLGYAGPVVLRPRPPAAGSEAALAAHSTGRASPYESGFLPITDRWRIGMPPGYVQNTRAGGVLDPYGQNVLKGDYALPGTQDLFLVLGVTSDTLVEARRTPTPSNVSSIGPGKFEFFGTGESQFVVQNFIFSAELFKGDASFKPKDWSIRATAVANTNYVHAEELGLVNPDVREGRDRTSTVLAPQELFGEVKLADLSSTFDFVSVRAGIQGFTSDFRGFLFSDNEPGVRVFGNYDNNRWQYNAAWFHQLEKDTNSGLNTLDARRQDVFIVNLYRQDFLHEGYTAQVSFAANIDRSDGLHYDRNGFLVRPAPVGTIGSKEVDAYYFGWAGDGHIGRLNISHQFYQAIGRETLNPIAGRKVNINAQMAAAELSYDLDYVRVRASFLYLSGDKNPEDGDATGFDTIFDNPNFAGGGFSFFSRQAIRLTGAGVGLVGRNSFTPSLRTSKDQGQANFVNPGLFLYGVGADIDVTPKLKLITNLNYLQFADTSSLELILQDGNIHRDIGFDLSVGIEYRPLLNNNVIFTIGASALVPGQGFKDLYTSETLYSMFVAMTLTY